MIQHFYTLECDHHTNSSNHLSLYKFITLLLTISPFTISSISLSPSPLLTIPLLSVSMSLFLFGFLPFIHQLILSSLKRWLTFSTFYHDTQKPRKWYVLFFVLFEHDQKSIISPSPSTSPSLSHKHTQFSFIVLKDLGKPVLNWALEFQLKLILMNIIWSFTPY